MDRYDPQAIEAKWQAEWEREGAFVVPNPTPDDAPGEHTYVLEMLKGSMLGINPDDPSTLAGQLTRVSLDGTRTVVASEGLVWPTGVAVDADGNIYVATWGVMANMGQVWKIAPPA